MSSIYYASTYMEIWGNPHPQALSTYETNLMWTIKSRHTLIRHLDSSTQTILCSCLIILPYLPGVIMKETNFDYNHNRHYIVSTTFRLGNWMNGSVSATGIYRHDKSNDFFDLSFNRKHISAILAEEMAIPPNLAEAITSISYLTHSISRKPFKEPMTSNQSFS